MTERVPSSLRRIVKARAGNQCEYCHYPERLALHSHEVDHVIPILHTGQTTSGNLAYACLECNRYKGLNVASFDPQTKTLTPLFHPRNQLWGQHFRWENAIIVPLTPEGRVTINVLQMNLRDRVEERQVFIDVGVFFVS